MHTLWLFLSPGAMGFDTIGHIEQHEVVRSISIVKLPAERRKDGLELCSMSATIAQATNSHGEARRRPVTKGISKQKWLLSI
jgi:hypothetical protein